MKNAKEKKYIFSFSMKSIAFIWREKKTYLVLILINILLDSIKPFPPMFLLNYAIDLFTSGEPFNNYFMVIAVLVLIMLVISVLSTLAGNKMQYVKLAFYADIRIKLNNICMYSDYSRIKSKDFKEKKAFAIAALDQDCLDVFIRCIHRVLSCVLTMSGAVFIISDSSLWVLLALVLSVIINLYSDYHNARNNFVDTKERTEYQRKSGYLRQISSDFSFAKEIRLLGLKDCFHKRMDEVDELLFRLREKRRKDYSSSAVISHAADALLDIVLYLFYGYQVLVRQMITLGQFSLYINALRQLKTSMDDIIYSVASFTVKIDYLSAFFSFIDQKVDERKDTSETFSEARIEFENVWFRYPGADDYALKDVSITLEPGERLLIVGENGAGKSTFAKLLCGLYRPDKGRILVNGVDLSAISDLNYWSNIAAVFQDYKLLAMPIAENISSMEPPDTKKLIDALKMVRMFEAVTNTPERENTHLYRLFDEHGVEFSGGQMQRLAIARAFYKKAPILILDEPTSALDPIAENEVYLAFKNISSRSMTVFISHRMSSVRLADKIAVFKSGEIIGSGTHSELIENNNYYRELYSLQAVQYSQEGVETYEKNKRIHQCL